MECPACSNTLVRVTASNVELDFCQNGCGGIWFDSGELKKFDEQHEFMPSELLLQKRLTEETLKTFPRKCPSCEQSNLTRQNYDWKNPVEIDVCWKCNGMWVDIHELSEIRQGEGDREAAGNAFLKSSIDLSKMASAKRGEHDDMSGQQSAINSLRKFFFGDK